MIKIVFRSGGSVDPPVLETWLSSPPTLGEVIEVDLDQLNLRSYAPAAQDAMRTAGVRQWEVVSCERRLPRVDHASPTSAADEHEAIIRPRFTFTHVPQEQP